MKYLNFQIFNCQKKKKKKNSLSRKSCDDTKKNLLTTTLLVLNKTKFELQRILSSYIINSK